MTSALTISNDTVIIEDETRQEASDLLSKAGDHEFDGLLLVFNGQEHRLPESLEKLVLHVIVSAANGGAVTVRTMPDELTTTVAAEMIGVSRPTLMKLIASGEIGARDVGSHKRLKAREVLEFRVKKLERQRNSFRELRDSAL